MHRGQDRLFFLRCYWIPLAVDTNCRVYLKQRGTELHEALTAVNALAGRGELPDASLADGVLTIPPRTNAVQRKHEVLTTFHGAYDDEDPFST